MGQKIITVIGKDMEAESLFICDPFSGSFIKAFHKPKSNIIWLGYKKMFLLHLNKIFRCSKLDSKQLYIFISNFSVKVSFSAGRDRTVSPLAWGRVCSLIEIVSRSFSPKNFLLCSVCVFRFRSFKILLGISICIQMEYGRFNCHYIAGIRIFHQIS